MSLLTSIAAGARRFVMTVVIGGTTVTPSNPKSPDGTPGVGRISVSRGFDDRVPRCSITVNRIPTRFSHGKTTTVDMGYDGFLARRFTGSVDGPARGFSESTITCVGQLWKLYQGVDVPDFDATGMTIQEAIANRLDLAGVTDYVIDNSLDYVLGSVVPARLAAATIADHVDQLMDIRDAEIYELSSGQVVVRPIEFQPAPTATGIAYDSETQALARVIDGSDREDWNYFKDKVTADGASVPDGDPDDPATTYTPIHREAEIIDSPLAALFPLGPGAHRTAILSQPLIDTIPELEAYAGRKLVRFARVPRYVSLDLAGDPTLELAQTRAVNLPGLDMSGRWFVYALTDSDDNAPGSDGEVPGYHSLVTFRGGDLAGGSVGIYPIASFTYVVSLEWINGVLMATVQFDASGSDDPDGDLDDANISWGDNQGGLISGTGFRKRVTVDPATDITGDWEVTVTVTDDDALVDTRMQVIDLTAAGSATYVPAIAAASDTHSMYSPDSAETWNDNAESSCTATGARPSDGVHHGHVLYGFDDGHLALTRDGNLTRVTVLAAGAARMVFIAWDWRNTLVAYALTAELELFVCTNMDATTPVFGLYGGVGLRTTLGLPNALSVKGPIGLPAVGGVDIFGGTGTGFPLHAYDRALTNAWVTQIMLGDILTDGAGDPGLSIYDYTAPGYYGETMILTNCAGRANGSIPIYHTDGDAGGPSATWTRATGLPAGLEDGRAILPNGPLGSAAVRRIAIFGDAGVEDVAYKSVDGIDYSDDVPGVIPAGFVTNHAMWESDVLTGLPAFDGVYLFALENAGTDGGVYKSVDECSSEVQVLRDDTSDDAWPGGAKCLQLSLGAPGASVETPEGLCIASGTYVGTSAPQDVALPFDEADLIIIKDAASNNGAIYRTSNMPANESYNFNSRAKYTDAILSSGAGKFTVGANADGNLGGGSPRTYHWVAIRDSAGLGTNMKVGSFTGNSTGTESQTISGFDWQPAVGWVTRDGASGQRESYIRTKDMGTNESKVFSAGAMVTNALKSLNADGFTVGPRLAANNNGDTIYYVMFRETDFLHTGYYTGDGAGPDSITTALAPDFVATFIDSATATALPRFRANGGGWSGTDSTAFSASGSQDVSDAIRSLEVTGNFIVGSDDDTNESTKKVYWVAIKASC